MEKGHEKITLQLNIYRKENKPHQVENPEASSIVLCTSSIRRPQEPTAKQVLTPGPLEGWLLVLEIINLTPQHVPFLVSGMEIAGKGVWYKHILLGPALNLWEPLSGMGILPTFIDMVGVDSASDPASWRLFCPRLGVRGQIFGRRGVGARPRGYVWALVVVSDMLECGCGGTEVRERHLIEPSGFLCISHQRPLSVMTWSMM